MLDPVEPDAQSERSDASSSPANVRRFPVDVFSIEGVVGCPVRLGLVGVRGRRREGNRSVATFCDAGVEVWRSATLLKNLADVLG